MDGRSVLGISDADPTRGSGAGHGPPDHFKHARRAGIDHGEAVLRARTFCPSGNGAGAHGTLSPCDECTDKAITQLIVERGLNQIARASREMGMSLRRATAAVERFAAAWRAERLSHRPWKRNARRYT